MAVYSRNPLDYLAARFAYYFLRARVAEWIACQLMVFICVCMVLAVYFHIYHDFSDDYERYRIFLSGFFGGAALSLFVLMVHLAATLPGGPLRSKKKLTRPWHYFLNTSVDGRDETWLRSSCRTTKETRDRISCPVGPRRGDLATRVEVNPSDAGSFKALTEKGADA